MKSNMFFFINFSIIITTKIQKHSNYLYQNQQVAASAKTTLLETSVNAVLRVIMVMPFMVPTMIVSHVLAPTEVPVSSYLMIQLCVWSALRDMQVRYEYDLASNLCLIMYSFL